NPRTSRTALSHPPPVELTAEHPVDPRDHARFDLAEAAIQLRLARMNDRARAPLHLLPDAGSSVGEETHDPGDARAHRGRYGPSAPVAAPARPGRRVTMDDSRSPTISTLSMPPSRL